MKVLFLLNSDFGVSNTIGARAYPIYKELVKKNINVQIFCRDYNRELNLSKDCRRVILFGKFLMQVLTAIPIYVSKKIPTDGIKSFLFDFMLKQKLRFVNLDEIDFIHSWDFLPQTFKYIKKKNPNISIYQDVPIVLTNFLEDIKDSEILFKGVSPIQPKYITQCFDYIDEYIVPSEFVKKSLIKENINSKNIHIVPFGVDITKFTPQLASKSKKKEFNVAFAGLVNERKGLRYLITAWKNLNLKDAHLNLYGSVYPELKPFLVDCEKYNIHLHGFVNLKEELKKNSLFVFPSLMEGSSKAVYEAMASGLPVITTFNSGSVIQDSVEGKIIPIQDIDSIEKNILFFYDNRDKLETYSKAARKKVLKYTWKHYAQKVSKVYLK